MNAAVVQNPRLLGLLGRRNYLVIGLPLLQALSPEEFRAVLAHEFAHLSRGHGRLGTWIYRVRTTWLQLVEARKSWGRILFGRFFAWYLPYFNAHAFPLLRAHEYEADRLATQAAGGGNLAQALARLVVCDHFLATRYWPTLYERVADEPQPPPTAFALLEAELAAARRLPAAQAWLEEELERPADPTDTHPSFAERLDALGIAHAAVLAPDGAGETAAGRLLAKADPS